ncbi:MAG TPA: putative lipid II flippase FtsW [bacterium]|nr:putative lipid II flippase FtsW [bacterium]
MSKTARIFFIAVYVLVGVGVVMTYSASAVYAERTYHNSQYFLYRQLLFVLIGTFLLFVTASIPVSFWREHARTVVIGCILLLLTVLIPGVGHTAGGAQRWLRLGSFHLQPSEFAKLGTCLYLCDYLSRKMKIIKKGSITIFFPPLLLVMVVCALTVLQPDLGSCAFIFIVSALLFFLSGIRMRYVLIASLMFLPVLYFLVIRVPYRLSRVTAYLNPWDDPQGSGFQMIQSFLAFGVGGIQGVGLGQSTQKLFYLPSGYNDFILSIIGEELGLIGVLGVMLLFGVIFFCGVQMAEKARHDYERLLILSLTFLIVLQALVNMMVATGLIPTKGLPLPFVSYGGTSMVVNLIGVGLLVGIDHQARERR